MTGKTDSFGRLHNQYIDCDSGCRLFMQPHSDDSSHDEALSNRVSALNMLDLTLEHLDVNVGDAGQALDLVVKACGTSELCCSPFD